MAPATKKLDLKLAAVMMHTNSKEASAMPLMHELQILEEKVNKDGGII